ncbi:hypothetical protein ACFQKF_20860 [Halalkalicoccus sp. GCM10025322]|uniref:hypothetical protein n=2 Tax=Halococcaceae TaxID=1963270 RepID=UPI002F963E5B
MTVSDNSDGTDTDDEESESEPELRAAIAPRDYDLLTAMQKSIGNASSTCECCGKVVDGHDLDEFIIGEFTRVDFSDENHVLLCRDCHDRPDWKERVKASRREQQINSRLDKVIHWVSRPPAKTLFVRRATAGLALLLTATAFTTTMTALTSGLGPLWDYATSLNYRQIAYIVGGALVAGYWLHLNEREQHDNRGTTVRQYDFTDSPWSVLGVTTIGFTGASAIAYSLPTSRLWILALCAYLSCSYFAFTRLETAVRADRCHPRVNWIPRYDRELFGLRMSVLVGLASLVLGTGLVAIVPAVAITAYLVARKWHDLGENWELLYYGGDSRGDD